MDERFDRLETDVSVLKSDVQVLKLDVAVLKSDVSVLKSDVAVLKSDVSTLKSDVADLKADVHELNQTTITKDYLKESLQELKDDSMIKIRKTNDKVSHVVRVLRDTNVVSESDASRLLAMEPFPMPK